MILVMDPLLVAFCYYIYIQIRLFHVSGPAHKAGLECGDVIIYWDGIKVSL